MSLSDIKDEVRAEGKLKYSQKRAKCTLAKENNLIKAVFDETQRAVTPRQVAVFYNGDYVIGNGAIIKR